MLFDGDTSQFFTRPISGTLLVIFLLVAFLPMIRTALTRRRPAEQPNETKELV